MREQLEALGTLQQIDFELVDMKEKLRQHPQEVSRLREELESIKDSVEESRDKLKDTKKRRMERELELNSNLDHIKRAEARLFEIKTYREYEALQKEIADTKRANAELEEEILSDMESIEALEQFIQHKETELFEKENSYEEKIAGLEKEIARLNKIYQTKLDERNQRASKNIAPEILSMYERIKKRVGTALSPVRDGICAGCNMNIPPQLFNEVLTGTRIIQCPSCHRIIHCEEAISQVQTA